MSDPGLDSARRAWTAACRELEYTRSRGDSPSKESWADAVLELLERLRERDLYREALEVIAEASAERDVVEPLRVELAHQRARAAAALGDRATVEAALRVVRADTDAIRGKARAQADRELAALTRDVERALGAHDPAPVAEAPARRYAHPKFGVGVEIGGDEKIVRLRFEDGTERAILRSKLTAS